MALFQISEPGMTPAPHERKRAVGIDLGTTNSLIASMISSKATILPNAHHQLMTPSVVYYGNSANKKGQFLVGDDAKAKATEDPSNVISSAKRLLGRSLQDILAQNLSLPYQFQASENGLPQLITSRGLINPIQVSSHLLKQLKQDAEDALGGEIDGAVITVPAYFDDAQRAATKEAANLSGLKLLRLLNEPTAAAIAYGLDTQKQGIIAVYDLGGGTFDISILRLHQGVFEVLATGGDTALGGDDFDRLIMNYLKERIKESSKEPLQLTLSEQQALLVLANHAKETLSEKDEVELSFKGWHGILTRATLESLIQPLVQRSIISCKRALRDAKVTPDQVIEIVMVGGSTRTPFVCESVEALFGKKPLVSIDPDQVVALGAAIQADILIGNKPDSDLLLLDVIPLSLGIETMGGLVEKIIPRNTTIPIAKAQEFTTFKEGQTAMRIHVLQGERDLVSDCRSLASFSLTEIPPMPAGAAHIRVTYQVDADGLLSVSATEKITNKTTEIQVKPSFGLTDVEIESMLKSSFEFAKEDKNEREWIEERIEAERLISDLTTALEKEGDLLLSEEERAKIDAAMIALQKSCEEKDLEQLERNRQVLDESSSEFAARRMNHAIKQALTGKSINTI